MKTLLILLLATCSLNAANIRTVGPDVRLVGTTHVDLAPIHQWIDGGRKGERPMAHWKFVTIETLQPTAPWPTCYIQIDQKEHKTVYLNNLPKELNGYLNRVTELENKKSELVKQIESDKKDLIAARAVDAQKHSEFAQNRRDLNAKLKIEETDLNEVKKQLDAVKSHEKLKVSDFAMFTGQIYGKMEVWDFGVKQ